MGGGGKREKGEGEGTRRTGGGEDELAVLERGLLLVHLEPRLLGPGGYGVGGGVGLCHVHGEVLSIRARQKRIHPVIADPQTTYAGVVDRAVRLEADGGAGGYSLRRGLAGRRLHVELVAAELGARHVRHRPVRVVVLRDPDELPVLQRTSATQSTPPYSRHGRETMALTAEAAPFEMKFGKVSVWATRQHLWVRGRAKRH